MQGGHFHPRAGGEEEAEGGEEAHLFCAGGGGGHLHRVGSVQAGGRCAAPQPPAVGLSHGRVLARSESSRDGLRLRLSRSRLGDDCHSVSCTLAWQGTNLTQQLTRNLLHSNKHITSAGEQKYLKYVILLFIVCLDSSRLK